MGMCVMSHSQKFWKLTTLSSSTTPHHPSVLIPSFLLNPLKHTGPLLALAWNIPSQIFKWSPSSPHSRFSSNVTSSERSSVTTHLEQPLHLPAAFYTIVLSPSLDSLETILPLHLCSLALSLLFSALSPAPSTVPGTW